MLDELTELPIYTQSLGLASAEVYEYDGVDQGLDREEPTRGLKQQ